MIIGPNPNRPEGFQFDVHGICCVSAPIKDGGPILELQSQVDTPLYYRAANGHITYFGAAFMLDTKETASSDDYIYVYGLQTGDQSKLVVARVKTKQFVDFCKWEFWNGSSWTSEKETVLPIADEISSELSVSVITDGFLAGKYVTVFQEWGGGNRLSIYISDSPEGPLTDPIRLYYCSESEEGNGIYTYNAKGHPHLSKPGELLVSYNVNTTSWDMHKKDASIYRPRFVVIKQFE